MDGRSARLHPRRLPEGAKVALIRAYMAHHQAMIIVAIANALHDGQMRERFHAEPIVKATELLLQERMPQRCCRGASAAGTGQGGGSGRKPHARNPAPLHHGALARAADTPAVQRPLLDHVDRCRLRLQPLARCGGDALARRSDLRRVGLIYFPARCPQRRHVVGRISAERGRA